MQHPSWRTLHYLGDPNLRDKKSKEAIRCSGLKPDKTHITERNEFPFACTREGGCGASVWHVPTRENRQQGWQLSTFVSSLQPGEEFIIKLVPSQKQPKYVPMPIYKQDIDIRKWIKNKNYKPNPYVPPPPVVPVNWLKRIMEKVPEFAPRTIIIFPIFGPDYDSPKGPGET